MLSALSSINWTCTGSDDRHFTTNTKGSCGYELGYQVVTTWEPHVIHSAVCFWSSSLLREGPGIFYKMKTSKEAKDSTQGYRDQPSNVRSSEAWGQAEVTWSGEGDYMDGYRLVRRDLRHDFICYSETDNVPHGRGKQNPPRCADFAAWP